MCAASSGARSTARRPTRPTTGRALGRAGPSAGGSADHGHRASGVGGDMLAHRAEHQTREAAVTPRTDHEQVGVSRLLDEYLGRGTLLDTRLDEYRWVV